jgi:UDP-N-acetylglucosamine--N-acetylmuramyl-(pentapeptide) pyrophosphoryl-undecaprenol N-acetylglucosamine transferase
MDDHQTANAAVLDKAGAAWVVRQDALDAAGLSQLLMEILTHPRSLSDRAAAAKALGHADAAERLADLAEHLAEGRPA